MPFTISHVTAILPLQRQDSLPFSALVIGAMIPDYPIFLPLQHYHLTHSLLGLFLFNLPAGLLVYGLWKWVFREPTRKLVPSSLHHLWRRSPQDRLSLVCTALVLGAATHVFWDGFTHSTGMFVQLIPWLRTRTFFHFPMYKFLQYGSSVLGLVVIGFWLFKQNKPQPGIVERNNLWKVVGFWTLVVVIALIAGWEAAHTKTRGVIWYYGIVSFTKTVFLLWLGVCLFLKPFCLTPGAVQGNR